MDRSSTRFPEQLDRLLHDQEWIAALKLAPDDELVKLTSHLDNVRSTPTETKSRSSPAGS